MLTVYSKEGCPRCKVLKLKLEKLGMAYDECHDVDVMQGLGIMSLPVLSVDGELLTFEKAVAYLKEKGKNTV